MTKKQLIEALAAFPDDTPVVAQWAASPDMWGQDPIVDVLEACATIVLIGQSSQTGAEAAYAANRRQNRKEQR